ncbi:MAG: hypothetical protein METHP_00718 [Methanoregula sp. SKADARSKE-2]|nr:MAG: hypothetical protein METHP_00718 [Methanoregula sp. SKADARSKE-2]
MKEIADKMIICTIHRFLQFFVIEIFSRANPTISVQNVFTQRHVYIEISKLPLMSSWIRFLIVSAIALALTAVILFITLPRWAGTGTPVFMQDVHGVQQKNAPDQEPAGVWITIDPLPDIPATGNFTISGSCSLPEKKEIDLHAMFLFSHLEAGTYRTWSEGYS